jgi:hypothetical protein
MALPRKRIPAVLLSALLLPGAAQAQRAKPPGFPDGPGKEVVVAKCFQRHSWIPPISIARERTRKA